MEIWNNLLEYYYLNTSKKSWQKFINDLKKKTDLKCKISVCEIALDLIAFGDEDGLNVLKEYNIPTNSLASIKSGINRLKTSIDLIDAMQNNDNKKESYSFHEMLGSIEMQLGYQLKVDEISLERWIGIIKSLNKKHEIEQQSINKLKSKQR